MAELASAKLYDSTYWLGGGGGIKGGRREEVYREGNDVKVLNKSNGICLELRIFER
jgi:hypothetical protein